MTKSTASRNNNILLAFLGSFLLLLCIETELNKAQAFVVSRHRSSPTFRIVSNRVASTATRQQRKTAAAPFQTTRWFNQHPDSLQNCFSKRNTELYMVSYEDLMEKLPSKSVIDAVEQVSRQQENVVASDVAAAAGVSLSQARRDLTALASISRGDIAVSADGDLIYRFPANLQGVLANNSVKYKALQAFQKAWPTLFWLVRISFGVTLLVSILAIFSTIFFIQSSSSSSSDDDRRDNRTSGGMRMGGGYYGSWFGPLDFFYYRPYGYYGYYNTEASGRRDPEDMGFLESVFSYIFGDGNPNAQLEEKRLRLAADVIRQNKGAVTAEQLAPFCDDAPLPSSSSSLDEEARYVDEVRSWLVDS